MNRFVIPLFSLFSSLSFAADTPLEEVVVNADFQSKTILNTAASLSVIGDQELDARSATHLEDILNVVPNLNFSSGASRGRFFQIRGIGERSQFVDPINPSVGLIIDGIDFTGVGGAATTLDIKQVEVLRGPQGTLYGANALAGLINIVSQDPHEAEGKISLTLGEFNQREFTQVVSGPVSDRVAMRFAVSKNKSNGYIRNSFLNKEDTNGIDENTIRTKLHWQASEDSLVKVTGVFIDTDNGYDAFSLDNTRETLSDEPGRDTLSTRAAAVQYDFSGFELFNWESIVSAANSDTEYGYDEDWSFREICTIDSDCAFYQYSTTDNYERSNKNISLDTRLLADSNMLSWVGGLYYRAQNVDLLRTYTNNDPGYDTFYGPIVNREVSLFSSEYDTQNLAAYAQLDFHLSSHLDLVFGVRAESRNAEYQDSNGQRLDTDDNLWGGKLSLEYRGFDDQLLYALVSRGYKAGGNNVPASGNSDVDALIPVLFDTEFMWNYELGYKSSWLDGNLSSQLSIFYQDREDIQINQSLVTSLSTGELDGECPCDFNGYISNAASGNNYGLELEVNVNLGDRVRAWTNVGILKTAYEDFLSFSHISADTENGVPYDLEGRAQAHAPEYQLALGFEFSLLTNLFWRIDAEAKDEFFLSPRHDVKTESYTLYNTRISYQTDDWQFAVWGKNLSDEEVIVRGFGSFGNDPRTFYATSPYFQFGAPRTAGVSATLKFN